MFTARWLGAGLAMAVLACSSPDLDGIVFHCQTDSDCLAGHVCGMHEGARACVPGDGAPLAIGMTGAFRGPSADLGVELRRGVLAAFARTNAEGGVSGRRLALDSKNDDEDPTLAVENVERLLDIAASPSQPPGPNAVLALLGSVGTNTTLATAPIANEHGVVLFSPMSGAHEYLRDGTQAPYVYNFRPGYFEETEFIVEYLASQRQPRIISDPPGDSYSRLLVFAQNDAYGDAGYAGLVEAYNRRAPVPQPDPSRPEPSIARVSYEPGDLTSVEPAIAGAEAFLSRALKQAAGVVSVGIVMVDTYQFGNAFIRALRDWQNGDAERAQRLDISFSHVSGVGSEPLAALLSSAPADYPTILDPSRRSSYAEGVLVTQVVPSYLSDAPGIEVYRRDIDSFDGGSYGFTSLEGYLAARLFVEALTRSPELSSASLKNTLDTALTDVDLGIGAAVGLSAVDHQASHTVWGSVLLPDGSITVPFVWTAETGIAPN